MADESWTPVDGEIVWAKCKRTPWWPGQVDAVLEDGSFRTLFLADNTYLDLTVKNLRPWAALKARKPPTGDGQLCAYKSIVNRYVDAVAKANELIATVDSDDESGSTMMGDEVCAQCGSGGDEAHLLICEDCNAAYHTFCLAPPLDTVPEGDWRCAACDPVNSLVTAAIANVLRANKWPPLPVEDSALAADLVEVKDGDTWRPARIIERREKRPVPGVFVLYTTPQPPPGVWLYYTLDGELPRGVIRAVYQDAAVAAAVEEVFIGFQQHSGLATVQADSSAAVLNSKLSFGSCLILPEFHVAEENDTPSKIAGIYGRSSEQLVDLNTQRPKSLPGVAELTESARLRKGTVILLPPGPPSQQLRTPRGPSNASLQRVRVLMQPLSPAPEVGSRIWLSTKQEFDEAASKWRPASVVEVSGENLVVSDISGDRGWKEELSWDDEGSEWLRVVPFQLEYQTTPVGDAGTGNLVPPYATFHQVERLTRSSADKNLRPRPQPPALDFVRNLREDRWAEVLFDGAWHLARLKRLTSNGFLVVLPDVSIDYQFTVECGSAQLRPPTTDRWKDAVMDEMDDEGEPDAEVAVADPAADEDVDAADEAEEEAEEAEEEAEESDADAAAQEAEEEAEEEEEVEEADPPPKRRRKQAPTTEEVEDAETGEEAEAEAEADGQGDAIEIDDDEELERSPPKEIYVPDFAFDVVNRVKDLSEDEKRLLPGAQEVLEEHFGGKQDHQLVNVGLVRGFLGVGAFKSPGLQNMRPVLPLVPLELVAASHPTLSQSSDFSSLS